MNHYYTNDPDLAHDEQQFNFELGGQNLTFTTDNGVFSKRTIDYGSRVLIETVLAQALPAGNILDVGTGYGPIGLTMAKHFPNRTVVMSDVNQRALGLAERNAKANQVTNVEIVESAAYQAITGQFGVVLTNPPIRAGKEVVSEIVAGAADFLLPGGQLYVVIQKKQGAPSALKLMQATYSEAEILKKDRGYYILKAIK